MEIVKSNVRRIEIFNLPRLDPIRVYLEDYDPGKGRITISCYDAAWVGYWGAMGGRTISQFFIDCNAEYLAGNLGCASTLRQAATCRNYLVRIVEAVQQALKEAGHD